MEAGERSSSTQQTTIDQKMLQSGTQMRTIMMVFKLLSNIFISTQEKDICRNVPVASEVKCTTWTKGNPHFEKKKIDK